MKAAVLQTSSAFASASASGADWREVGRKILEALESIRTEADQMNIGFLYTTVDLTPDLPALLSLLKDVTRIAHWYGSTGQGICGNGLSYAGQPAAVAMIGTLPPDSFHGFSLPDDAHLPGKLQDWMKNRTPSAGFTHGILCAQAASRLRVLRERDGLYAIGGFAGGPDACHISDGSIVHSETLSGVFVDSSVTLMTATSFGCAHAGGTGRITKCSGNVIEEINHKPACEALHEAIDSLQLESGASRSGHVHAAFPVPGSDHGVYLVRNITNADEETGHLSVAHHFEEGDAVRFVYRDRMTATSDLTQVLTGLYGRAADQLGAANTKPKAILYFGCGARMPEDGDDEAQLIKKVFGDVPMAGFYTAAEICNGHVFGYTGILAVFL